MKGMKLVRQALKQIPKAKLDPRDLPTHFLAVALVSTIFRVFSGRLLGLSGWVTAALVPFISYLMAFAVAADRRRQDRARGKVENAEDDWIHPLKNR